MPLFQAYTSPTAVGRVGCTFPAPHDMNFSLAALSIYTAGHVLNRQSRTFPTSLKKRGSGYPMHCGFPEHPSRLLEVPNPHRCLQWVGESCTPRLGPGPQAQLSLVEGGGGGACSPQRLPQRHRETGGTHPRSRCRERRLGTGDGDALGHPGPCDGATNAVAAVLRACGAFRALR